jgi:hypothetical protein
MRVADSNDVVPQAFPERVHRQEQAKHSLEQRLPDGAFAERYEMKARAGMVLAVGLAVLAAAAVHRTVLVVACVIR